MVLNIRNISIYAGTAGPHLSQHFFKHAVGQLSTVAVGQNCCVVEVYLLGT